MNKTLLVMLNEIRTTLRRKSFMLLAVGVPLLMGAIALIMMVVNRDDSLAAVAPAQTVEAAEAARRANGIEGDVGEGGLIQTLPADIPPGRLTGYATPESAQAALEAGENRCRTLISADVA